MTATARPPEAPDAPEAPDNENAAPGSGAAEPEAPADAAPGENGGEDAPPDGSEDRPAHDPAAGTAALKDRLLRAVAETENLRKRAAREREEASAYAISDFARGVVDVADDLARALDNIPDGVRAAADSKAFVEGLELTRRNLDAVLERRGVVRIDPAGETFDHHLHEAMFEVEAADAEPGAVVHVVQVGYRIRDRLLRPARVGVAKRRRGDRDDKDDKDKGACDGNGEPE